MTPKEKAEEIYSWIYKRIDDESESVYTSSVGAAKDVSIYLVGEINKAISDWDIGYESNFSYWNEVKKELEK